MCGETNGHPITRVNLFAHIPFPSLAVTRAGRSGMLHIHWHLARNDVLSKLIVILTIMDQTTRDEGEREQERQRVLCKCMCDGWHVGKGHCKQ